MPGAGASQGPQGTPGNLTLELYQKESDPFSHSVRNRLSRLGLDFICHNVPAGQPFKHEQLVHAGGKDQIPFLIDRRTGVKLYNSQSIIAYLENEYGELPENRIKRWAQQLRTRVETRADQIGWAIREPMERARTAVDDMNEGWESLRRSYQAVREAFMKQGAAENQGREKKAA